MEEQKRIAAILDKADAIRRKREQAIQLADEFLRSLFLDMFGDPVRNPKGWPVLHISDLGNVTSGLQVTQKRASNALELPYLRVANVFRDRLNLKEIKTLRATREEVTRASLSRNDLLVVEGHGNRDEIGRCAVWTGSISPCLHQNHLIRIRLKTEADPNFVSAVLNSASGRKQFFVHGKTTSGLNTISTTNVKSVRVISPPYRLQRCFAEIKKRLQQNLRREDDASQIAANLSASLTKQAFQVEL